MHIPSTAGVRIQLSIVHKMNKWSLVVLLFACISVTSGRVRTTTENWLSTLGEYTNRKPADTSAASCDIQISADLGRYSPVLVYPDTTRLVRAHDDSGRLHFGIGDAIQVECPGNGNTIVGQRGNALKATCKGGKTFWAHNDSVAIRKLECKNWPEHKIYRNGTCLYGKSLFTTAFNISTGLVPIYESCVDATKRTTIYTKFTLQMDAVGSQVGVKRPGWKDSVLFSDKSTADNHYRRPNQVRAFETLLGSEELANKYIKSKGDYFLSRGHLMAKSDNVHGAAQMSTFWHSNAAPQWQTFNGGNWNALEIALRKFSAAQKTDLICFTGTFGVATLPDVNGQEVELYLRPDDRTMPVPRLFYKLLYNANSQAGIVFGGMNNPYETLESVLTNVRCRDICESISWIKWKIHDLVKGYIFCCEVNDFRENYPGVVPAFPVGNILR